MSPCLYAEYSSLLPLWFHLSTFSFIHMIMDEMGCMLSHLELSKQNGAQVPPPEILVYWEEDWRSWEGFPGGLSGNKSTCQCKRRGFNPWVGKIPWQRKWQPTPVFLPGEFHGQRSPVGSMGSPWGHKESDNWMTAHTERLGTGDSNGAEHCWSADSPHAFPKLTHLEAHAISTCRQWPHPVSTTASYSIIWAADHLPRVKGNSQSSNDGDFLP